MTSGGSNKKVANKLVAASFAAVLTVYVAGYSRTQSAADRLATQIAAERRAASPGAAQNAAIISEFRAESREEFRRRGPRGLETRTPGASESSNPARERAGKFPSLVAPAEPVRADSPITAIVGASAPAAAETPEPSSPTAVTPAVEHNAEVAAAIPAAPPAPAWKDGTYTGWGYSRHGNIEAAVVIEGGRIASATISQCRTRYSCSVIDQLPPQVAKRQSPDVDYVSGATQSADAFYGAVVEALSKAK
jgi:uncharacterized protein with FMN-binding domain